MVRIAGLTITALLVAFQLWYAAASPAQRDAVPAPVERSAYVIARTLAEAYDAASDVIGPRWAKGWEQTKVSLGLQAAPVLERSGVVATGQDLTGQDFAARRLAEASFGRSTLNGADFTKAYLVRASLDGASAVSAVFDEAILERASLRGVDLSGASLVRADLTGTALDAANLSGADLSGVIGLTEPQLAAACGDEATILPAGFAVAACDAAAILPVVQAEAAPSSMR